MHNSLKLMFKTPWILRHQYNSFIAPLCQIETYARQDWIVPPGIRVKIKNTWKNTWNHHLVYNWLSTLSITQIINQGWRNQQKKFNFFPGEVFHSLLGLNQGQLANWWTVSPTSPLTSTDHSPKFWAKDHEGIVDGLHLRTVLKLFHR